MFNIVETDKTTIYVIGDIHGEFKAIGNWIKTNNLRDCALIFCGDFGLGFDGLQKEHDDLTRAQRLCEERNVDCYMIREKYMMPKQFKVKVKLAKGDVYDEEKGKMLAKEKLMKK